MRFCLVPQGDFVAYDTGKKISWPFMRHEIAPFQAHDTGKEPLRRSRRRGGTAARRAGEWKFLASKEL
jgi:hypothetical protein